MPQRFSVLIFLFLFLIFSGCASGNSEVIPKDDSASVSPIQTTNPANQTGVEVDRYGNISAPGVSSSRVPEVEEKSGFDLPEDAEIFTAMETKRSYIFSFYSNESNEDLKTYFNDEFSVKGYPVDQNWSSFSYQNYTSWTATFAGKGERLNISIEDQNDRRLVNISRWY